jgi:hypothetical protein
LDQSAVKNTGPDVIAAKFSINATMQNAAERRGNLQRTAALGQKAEICL